MNDSNRKPLLFFFGVLTMSLLSLIYLNFRTQTYTLDSGHTWAMSIVSAILLVLLSKPIPVVDQDTTKSIGLDFYLNLIILLIGGYYVLLISSVIATTYNVYSRNTKGFSHRSFITFLSIMIAIQLMGLTYTLLGGDTGSDFSVLSIFPLLFAGTVNFIMNGLLLTSGITLESGQGVDFFKKVYQSSFKWAYRYLLWDSIYAFLCSLAVISMLENDKYLNQMSDMTYGIFLFGMTLLLTVILYYPMRERLHSFEINVQYNKQNIDLMELNNSLKKSNEQLEKTNDIAVKAFLAALKGKDSYTEGHSVRVSNYGVTLAKALGYSDQQLRTIEMAGFLHDIGKIKINENILNKPSKLTNEEYEEIKRHPIYGLEILQDMYEKSEMQSEDYQMMANITAMHHERYDGRGYPYGLKGEDIPFEARILAVADTFDAMTTTRSYRRGLTIEEAREEIAQNMGTQFCPVAASKFIECIDQGQIVLEEK